MTTYDSLQVSPLAIIAVVVFYAAVYVWLSLALARVFAKQGIPGWKAWVPVYNAMTFFTLGGQSVIWVFLSVLPVVSIVSFIFFVFALNGVSKRFGKGPGFTVLGVFLYGIWVSILGFGSARAVDPNAAPVYEPITKVPYGAPPIAQPPRADLVPPAPATAPAAPQPVPVAAPPAPAAPTPPPAAPTPPAVQEVEDHTVVVSRRTRSWTLSIDGGASIQLTGTVVMLGRNPAPALNAPDAQLVSLDDPTMTVSKTHARLELESGSWSIIDLDSTNGVVVDEVELQPGVPTVVSERFVLGELSLHLRREA